MDQLLTRIRDGSSPGVCSNERAISTPIVAPISSAAAKMLPLHLADLTRGTDAVLELCK